MKRVFSLEGKQIVHTAESLTRKLNYDLVTPDNAVRVRELPDYMKS